MAKIRKNPDPAECVMSLGDHLEELRARLILAVLGLVLGMVVSCIPAFGTRLLLLIEWPYRQAMFKHLQNGQVADTPRQEAEALSLVESFFSTLTERLASDPNAPRDLSPSRVAFLHDVAVQGVKDWVHQKHELAKKDLNSLISLAPAEAFMAYMKIAMIAGVILTAPWIFYQIWMFIAAGLYPKERQYVYKSVPFSAGLFILGALFFLFFIARVTLAFFLGFGDLVGVASQWTLQKYISFVTTMMLVFGLAFQTPIAVFILVRIGLISVKTLRKQRGFVLLGLAIVSAVVTPTPDPFTMLALLIPLYGLYELGILLGVMGAKKAAAQKAESEAAST